MCSPAIGPGAFFETASVLKYKGFQSMHSSETALSDMIDKLYVINLKNRRDRRQEILTELARIDLAEDSPIVKIFDAVKPKTADKFPSIGARGCFLSHLGVLCNARDAGYETILILEDDAALTSVCVRNLSAILSEIRALKWSLAYLGHRIADGQMPGAERAQTQHWRSLRPNTGVQTTHAMLVHQRALVPIIEYLEQMLARPAGHPEGGPMHVDGAYSWFRRAHPDHLTLITPEHYIVQRASRSDIAPASWKDKLPFLGLMRRLKNLMS